MHFLNDPDACRIPIGVVEFDWLSERVDVLVTWRRGFVVDDRLHVCRFQGREDLVADLHLKKHIEET